MNAIKMQELFLQYMLHYSLYLHLLHFITFDYATMEKSQKHLPQCEVAVDCFVDRGREGRHRWFKKITFAQKNKRSVFAQII